MTRLRVLLPLLLSLAVAGCAAKPLRAPVAPPVAAAATAPVTLRLIGFNDFHGQLSAPSPQSPLNLATGGVAWLAGLVGQLKAENPLNVVVAAGDLIGASPMNSALFHDEPTIAALSELGLEFSSVGNHEFDEGVAEIRRIQGLARFQYLAANVIDNTTGRTLFPPSAIKTFEIEGGRTLRVGFIGAVVKATPLLVVQDAVSTLTFLDEATAVNAAVPALRGQNVDLIVLLIHEGGRTSSDSFDDDTCPNFTGAILPILDKLDPAIDVVVSGHTHRTYICRRDGRLITSAGSQGRFVTSIDLTVDAQTKRITHAEARQLAAVHDKVPKSDAVQAIEVAATKAVEPLANRTIAEIKEDLLVSANANGESVLGDVIADAHLAATSAQIAFMNLSGIRTSLSAQSGRVTYGNIHAVHPFGNALITMSLTGAEIDELLEQQWMGSGLLQVSQGFSYEWDADASPGSRVDAKSIRLNGVTIDPAGSYRVTANEFLAAGGDGFKQMTNGTDRVRGVLDIEALERYLTTHSPVKAPKRDRITQK